ncbi:hypothetical protein EDB89DRAFT_1989195 [Lactarius sanguifluus]|nr:hypothetical protein EDB89DRAFT_1989195 [Lactarius sanguifluus]
MPTLSNAFGVIRPVVFGLSTFSTTTASAVFPLRQRTLYWGMKSVRRRRVERVEHGQSYGTGPHIQAPGIGRRRVVETCSAPSLTNLNQVPLCDAFLVIACLSFTGVAACAISLLHYPA